MKRTASILLLTRLWLLGMCMMLAACATQLAPAYDKAVVDGLAAVNTDAMILFASVSNGTDKSSFASRADKYNSLIGRLDALSLQAGARPMPKNKVTDAINRALDKRGSTGIVDDDSTPPSAYAIRKVSDTLAKMRDTDRQQGVTAYEALAFKGQAVIYLDQAITYENFLQR
ncbi:hypothetical protein H8L32_00495 [Undibacterium sp. CY18W]|uniref:LPP20 lipoprotein n=1 Tax=Undibacterium hunanense TaxID=2762292 RepID=A0ABR6ZJ78_9BURK|nr:hypothetical protein [Undibacterium hunanense]MBC3915949.1 hypothetical protein [Undibacterium hunanense]